MKNKLESLSIDELEALSKRLDHKTKIAYKILSAILIVVGLLLITIGYLLLKNQ